MRHTLLAGLFLLLPAGFAQRASPPKAMVDLRADVNLVLIPITVTDRRGTTILGLGEDKFALWDGRAPQSIVTFHTEDGPCSVGVVIDMSGSMRNTLGMAKQLVRAFLKASNPDDEFFLVGVSSKPETFSQFTTDVDELGGKLVFAGAGGSTALVDSIYEALARVRSAHTSRKALLIVSDGMDNNSRHSKAELLRLAVEADTQIYTIAIDGAPAYLKPVEAAEFRRGLSFMEEMAKQTGGLNFVIRNPADAPRAADKVGMALRNQYVIGFRPQSQDDSGKFHRLRIQVKLPDARIYARSGYYAP